MTRFVNEEIKTSKLGDFVFTAHCDTLEVVNCDGKVEIRANVPIVVEKNGEYIGEFEGGRLAYDGLQFDNWMDEDSTFTRGGEPLDDEEIFGKWLYRIHGVLLGLLCDMELCCCGKMDEYYTDLKFARLANSLDDELYNKAWNDKYYSALYDLWYYFYPENDLYDDDDHQKETVKQLLRSLERDNIRDGTYMIETREHLDFFKENRNEHFYQFVMGELEEIDFDPEETDERKICEWNLCVLDHLQSELAHMLNAKIEGLKS